MGENMNEKYSDRKQDMKDEQYISTITSQIYQDDGWLVSKSQTKQEQLAGIDFILERGNEQIILDEKAAITRLDGGLTTFAFELWSENNYNHIGWFCNRKLMTTHYGLIYPYSETRDIHFLDSIEIYIVSKKQLQGYVYRELNYNGITFANLKEQMSRIPIASNGKHYVKLNNTMKLVYSENIIPEKPINIVINKDFLRRISDYKYQKQLK